MGSNTASDDSTLVECTPCDYEELGLKTVRFWHFLTPSFSISIYHKCALKKVMIFYQRVMLSLGHTKHNGQKLLAYQ